MKNCKCGCGQEVKEDCRYVKCHSSRVIRHFRMPKPCACGCGALAEKGNSFIHGHNRKGFKHDAGTKKRIRETNLKTYSNPELIERFTGKNNPSYGTKHPNSILAIMQSKARERCSNPEFIQKISETTKAALSDPVKRGKISANSLAMWKNKESQERMRIARNAKPNRAESSLCSILDTVYPGEWKYTGDFSFIINGKCPDFVNCNGQKKIIELFGDYWHRGENPQDRIDVFTPFGYETLVIWEHELKQIESVTNKIRGFCCR